VDFYHQHPHRHRGSIPFHGLPQRDSPEVRLKADYPGIILSAAGCFALLLALSEGQDRGWTSLYIVNLFIFSGFTLALFVIWELNTDHPMLDIRLLNNATFAASLVCISIATMGLFSAIFLVPLFVQNVQGLTPLQTGLLMMPAAMASGVMRPSAASCLIRSAPCPCAWWG
jgi:hypothetical protein